MVSRSFAMDQTSWTKPSSENIDVLVAGWKAKGGKKHG
jgi:hypothetical protein